VGGAPNRDSMCRPAESSLLHWPLSRLQCHPSSFALVAGAYIP
jgi:hypothetical protein